MDERLPTGESVDELLRGSMPSLADANIGASRPRTIEDTTPATRLRAVSFDPQTGRPREEFYRDRGDTSGLLDAYQRWTPHGAKRGFKNSLKSGLALASEAVRNNPDDPVTAAIAGFGIGTAGGTAAPNFKNRLVRQWKMGQLGQEAKSDLERRKSEAAIETGQMVEVELDNGQRVMVPAKSAAALQSRQQEIGLRGDTLESRKKRWNQLGEHEAARDAQALYNSGAADDSAELRAEIARRLRLPAGTALPPRGLGNQIKIDDAGNYIVISPRSGAAAPVVKGEQSVGSLQKTQEATRQRRFEQQQANIDRRQSQRLAAQAGRAGSPQRLDGATKREIAKGVGVMERIKGELSALDERIKRIDDAAKGRRQTPEEVELLTSLGRQRAAKVNEARAAAAQLDALDPNSETGVGEGGYPYRKMRGQAPQAPRSDGRTIEGAIDAFTRKVGRPPTEEEIAKMRAALGQ